MAGKVLEDVSALQARIAELEKQNASLTAASQKSLTLKVSDKGALMVLGLQRFPVTLYRGQWERLIAFIQTGAIETFIAEHKSELSEKTNGK